MGSLFGWLWFGVLHVLMWWYRLNVSGNNWDQCVSRFLTCQMHLLPVHDSQRPGSSSTTNIFSSIISTGTEYSHG
jgi:hypothetical protein